MVNKLRNSVSGTFLHYAEPTAIRPGKVRYRCTSQYLTELLGYLPLAFWDCRGAFRMAKLFFRRC